VIPNVLVLGFVAGLLIYRRAWWLVPVAAVAWALVLALAGSCSGSCSVSAAVLGALNATVGVSVGVVLRWMITRTGRTLHSIR
jgi:hypothetical protein